MSEFGDFEDSVDYGEFEAGEPEPQTNVLGGELGVPFGPQPDPGPWESGSIEEALSQLTPEEVDKIGEGWRATNAARTQLEEQQLVEALPPLIEDRKRALGRMGDHEEIAQRFDASVQALGTALMAQGLSPEQAAQAASDPELLRAIADDAIHTAHWMSLTQRMKNQINPRGEEFKRLQAELQDLAGGGS